MSSTKRKWRADAQPSSQSNNLTHHTIDLSRLLTTAEATDSHAGRATSRHDFLQKVVQDSELWYHLVARLADECSKEKDFGKEISGQGDHLRKQLVEAQHEISRLFFIVETAKGEHVRKTNASIKRRDATITEKEAIIEQHQSTIADQMAMMDRYEATIAQQEVTINQQKTAIFQAEATIVQQGAIVNQQQSAISQAQETIEDLQLARQVDQEARAHADGQPKLQCDVEDPEGMENMEDVENMGGAEEIRDTAAVEEIKDADTDEDVYEVTDILDSQISKGTGALKYLVSWMGYEESSWELWTSVLPSSKEAVRDFHWAYPERPGPPPGWESLKR